TLAGRMENGNDKDKEKAKALREVLRKTNEWGTEAKFDALVRELTRPGADKSIDVLNAAVRDNEGLRRDLQERIRLLTKDDAKSNKEKMERTARLLEQIKELIAKQERVRTSTEMGRKSNPELKKDQNKVTNETRNVADPKGGDGKGKDGEVAKGEL